MAAFEYTALDSRGREQKGVLEGDAPRQIRQQLREKGLAPLTVIEITQRKQGESASFAWFQSSLSAADLSVVTRQIATLVGSGLPVEESLKAASEQSEKAHTKRVLIAVRAKVMEGHDLATSMADFPKVFNELYRATVAAGEHSGHLDLVLEKLADYTEARQVLSQNVSQALVYPILVIGVAILIVAGLMTYVVPQVIQVFADTGQTLPTPTRVLITISDFLRDFGLLIVLLLAAMVVGIKMLLRQAKFQMIFHRILLTLPLFSALVRGLNASRFSRTLSILNESGVSLLDSLHISSQVVLNLPMKAAVENAARRVREGMSLHKALDQAKCFPPLTIHLIASGEASGRLGEMLARAADSQERDLQGTIQTLLSFLGPVVILILGAVVLGIVLAMLLPIFELNQLVL